MLNNDIVSNFLGFRNITIDKIRDKSNFIKIYIHTNKSNQICPVCGKPVNHVHDYRIQIIKHIPFRGKPILIVLKKRRYVCSCGKRFYEHYSFLPKYYRSTNQLYAFILTKLKSKSSMKDIAYDCSISPNIVKRAFNLFPQTKNYTLPEVLGIDEFKGNTGGEKYNLILTNLQDNKIHDILPTRKKSDIISYFKSFSLKQREKVKVFVMDMWNDYSSVSWLFPNAKVVVDKYHFVRQVYFALDRVRKRVQNKFPSDKRLHFKHNKQILWKEYSKLSLNNQIVLRNMLDQNEDLYTVWNLKEWFISINKETDIDKIERELHNWIVQAEESNIFELKDVITAFRNWFSYIVNSFRYKYTNGFTEGMNNNIKVLKRIAYGYRNFDNFRKRIMYCFG